MAADFLQGYLTCDTATLNSASLQPMAICNIKGRVVASGWACTLAEAEGVALVVHHSLQARIGEFLLPYVRFSKCELDARAWSLTVVENGLTYGAEHQLALTLEPGQPLQPADQRQLKYSLIEQGFALTSSATSEQFLPQMLNLEHTGAINFDKGCYLGQEIVARAQFRGAIKRGLSRFNWQGDCPQPGGTWQEGVVIDAVADAADENRGIGHAVVAR